MLAAANGSSQAQRALEQKQGAGFLMGRGFVISLLVGNCQLGVLGALRHSSRWAAKVGDEGAPSYLCRNC